MANSVKKKIRLGTAFLFVLLLLSSGLGIYHLVRLKNDAREILKDNYESIEYCHRMQRALVGIDTDLKGTLPVFDSILRLQEANITEDDEFRSTSGVRRAFTLLATGDTSRPTLRAIGTGLQEILSQNMGSIERKNDNAARTADKALTYITLLTAIIFLVGFTFSYNFPSVVTDPINVLIEGIRAIAGKDYRYRIHLDRRDEFGQMATAFNEMAERLEYFESSNLNKIIFEKTRAEAVINSLREASIGLDKDNVVLFANDQALLLLGLTATELVGKPVGEVSAHNDLLRFLLAEEGSLPFKVVLDNHENYFTKEVIDVAQPGLDNKVLVLRNITSYKELDVAKTNLIATISHELKTPLASSDFSLKLLEDARIGTLTDEQHGLVQTLRLDNQRMLKILSELLNMSQVEAGKIQLELGSVSAGLLVDAAISAVASAVRERGISIHKQMLPEGMLVRADAEKTVWVLNNFLTNAIKYSGEGATVEVTVRRSSEGVDFIVTDRGPGIPAEYHGKVFDRFFKVPGSKTAGNGLGLAISKEFIEAQSGRIWFTSEPGEGSSFGFTIPAA